MKYVIDIPEDMIIKSALNGLTLGIPMLVSATQKEYVIPTNIQLNQYTEFNRKDIEDEVWKFVEKLEYLTVGETEDCFDVEYEGTPFVAGMFSYQEAKAKYDAWKKEKEEIRVGDEVKHRGRNYVVGYVGADKVYHLIDENWLRTVVQGGYQLIKTGRHFPEVAELLEKMRGKYD